MVALFKRKGGAIFATISGSPVLGGTLTAKLPDRVIGTLQFTRTLKAAPNTRSNIAGAVANAVNSLQYSVQADDLAYDIGCDASATVSSSTNTSTLAAKASAPTSVVATAGDGTISVTFGAPASDGGAAIINYTATDSATGDSVSGSSPLNFASRANGVARTISVVANNSAGAGAAAVSNTVNPVASTTLLKHRDAITIANNNTYGLGRAVYSELNRDLIIRNPITNTVPLQLGSRDADNFANGNADYSSPIVLNPGEEMYSTGDTYQYFIRQGVASAVAGQTAEIERITNLGA